MNWIEFENIFNRALRYSFSRKKWYFVFPFLMLSGFIVVFCRTLSFIFGEWIGLTLAFLPLFLCATILLVSGIILIRIYYREINHKPSSYREIFVGSKTILSGVLYLAVPLILIYLILWMILGVFYLFRMIPHAGDIIGAIFSFGPFLLVFTFLLLAVMNLLFLFFMTPMIALKSEAKPRILFKYARENPFLILILPLLSLLPLMIVAGLLVLAAVITDVMYVESSHTVAIALQWFFTMIPFGFLLTPVVIFFFNFSAESYALLERKVQAT